MNLNHYADGSIVSPRDEMAICRAFGFASPDAMNNARENWDADLDRIYGRTERKAS